MNLAVILDTETTGISKQDQVIELAYLTYRDSFFKGLSGLKSDIIRYIETGEETFDYFQKLYKPSVDIHPAAYEVHGYTQTMLKDSDKAETLTLDKDIKYTIAHNASFDKRMLRQTMNEELHAQFDEIKWICTLSLAKTFDKQLSIGYENHKLDTVIRHHYPEYAEKLIQDKHKALGDCIKLILFLIVLVEKIPTIQSWEQLYNFQNMMKKSK